MNTKHPTPGRRFSWGKTTEESGTVTYRLFRRDGRNSLHGCQLVFSVEMIANSSRAWIAQLLRRKYRDLRDQVDEIDLALMEAIA